jgi:branched-chain amino acid transport system permease protein
MRFEFLSTLRGRQQELGDLFLVPRTQYYYLLFLVVAVLAVAFIIKRTRFGKALVSISESEDAAAHVGINTTRTKILAFAISAFFMGAAGSVMTITMRTVDPSIAFDVIMSFLPVLMVIFGGTRNLAGPVVGAAVFTVLRDFLRTNYPTYSDMSIGIVMLVAILFMPTGIVGLVQDVAYKVIAAVKKAASNKKGGAGHADP